MTGQRIPDLELEAYGLFLYRVLVDTRAVAWTAQTKDPPETHSRWREVASLMDLVHNLPTFFDRWEEWDEARFVGSLAYHDRVWKSRYVDLFRKCQEKAARS